MSYKEKVMTIRKYLRNTKNFLDNCKTINESYVTSEGIEINITEASDMFNQINEEIENILKN